MIKYKYSVIYFCLFILASYKLSAASLPKNPMGSNANQNVEIYYYTQTQPLLQRVFTDIDPIGTGSYWHYRVDGSSTPPDYYVHDTLKFQNSDTIVFSGGTPDSISLWSSAYSGFFEGYQIDNGTTQPMGMTIFFTNEIPVGDATLPLIVFLSIYTVVQLNKYKAKRKKKANC